MLFGAALATQPPDFATVTGRDVLIESAGFSAAHELYTQRITKGKLIESILVFGEHNLDQLANDSLVISSRSLHTALDLLRRLPNRVVLPRFAPDSEGGVILSWTTFGETMLTIVEDAMLHFVFNAGSADAVYVDDVPYEDGTIPEILLEWLERAA
jgi:hypothetical protein